MRVNIAIPEAQVTKPVLDAALESVTRLNEQLIDGGAPTAKQLIEQGAQWKPEPPGQEHFDHAGILAQRGWGDCDDWAPLHAASLRKTGEDPGAKAVVQRSGPNTWHAVVERSNGKIDDPSRAAGMGTNGHAVHGAVLPIMHAPAAVVGGELVVRPSLALRPHPSGWQARVDLPWHNDIDGEATPSDYAMAALHTAPVAMTALVGALEGAVVLGEAGGFAIDEHLARLEAISDAVQGCDPDELVRRYGPEHAAAAAQIVGSWFGDAFKAVTSPVTSAVKFVQNPSLKNLAHIVTDPVTSTLRVARPLAQVVKPLAPLVRFVPGVGPVAATALDVMANPPANFGDLAQRFAGNAMSFIPGIGPVAQAALPFIQQAMAARGGAPAPAPRPPQGMPAQFAQFMPQGMPQGWPQFGGFR
jgi:hypothetical protein